jgi:hypothetical protein
MTGPNPYTLAALHEWQAADAAAKGSYDDQTVVDLKSEIEKRNDGREDAAKLSASGNKSDLVAALIADDAQKEA